MHCSCSCQTAIWHRVGGGPSRPPLRRGRCSASVAVSASPTFDLGTATAIENPLALDTPAVIAAGVVGVILVIGGAGASLVAFVDALPAKSDGDERQQLRWVGVSLGLAVPLFVVGALLWGVVPGAEVLPVLASLAFPAGIAVAVLKYRLYEIDLVVNRALVYGVMTVGVVGSYVAVVGLVGATLSPGGDLVVSLVVTGVVAVCFQPLRARVQRFVNRLMYGERVDPYTAIARLGRTLASSLQLDAVLSNVVETIGQSLALAVRRARRRRSRRFRKARPAPSTARRAPTSSRFRSSIRGSSSASSGSQRDPASACVSATTA